MKIPVAAAKLDSRARRFNSQEAGEGVVTRLGVVGVSAMALVARPSIMITQKPATDRAVSSAPRNPYETDTKSL